LPVNSCVALSTDASSYHRCNRNFRELENVTISLGIARRPTASAFYHKPYEILPIFGIAEFGKTVALVSCESSFMRCDAHSLYSSTNSSVLCVTARIEEKRSAGEVRPQENAEEGEVSMRPICRLTTIRQLHKILQHAATTEHFFSAGQKDVVPPYNGFPCITLRTRARNHRPFFKEFLDERRT
jgi:hypothetical protein